MKSQLCMGAMSILRVYLVFELNFIKKILLKFY